MAEETCTWCSRPAKRSGLCWGHVKRHQRKRPMAPPLGEVGQGRRYPGRRARLVAVAVELADADTSDDTSFERVVDRLVKAAEAYRKPRTETVHADRDSRPRGQAQGESRGT